MASIGENVARLRAQRGWSQDALADKAGTTQTTIEKIEKGYTRRSRFFMDIAKALGVSMADLDPDLARPENEVVIPRSALVGERDLPIYSATEGGDGVIVIGSDAIDFVRRPAPLIHVREGYGVVVVGESMVPAFRPGDIALVHPLLPPRVQDVCVFQGSGAHGVVSSIKEFVASTEKYWRVKRYKPVETEMRLMKAQWDRCHVVVGKYSRR